MIPPTINTGIIFEKFKLRKSNSSTLAAPANKAMPTVITKHINTIRINTKIPLKLAIYATNEKITFMTCRLKMAIFIDY